jgi:multiple sugar transport system permease protein
MATQSASRPSVAVLNRPGSTRRIVVHMLQATLWYVGLVLIGSIFLLPFFWMLTTSVKAPIQVFKYPIQWLPDPIVWNNYIDAWTALPFTTFLRNTLIITITAMIGETLTSSLVAFSFARIPFRGRNLLFVVLLATMMLPPQVTLIPRFIIFAKLNLIDTFVPLILPAFFAQPFYTFLLRQFFLTIPNELEDAAFVDGASRFRLWWSIFLPLSKPALATVMIFAFIAHWNEFFDALIYLNSQRNKTLALGLSQLREAHSTEWHWMMAIAVLMVLPCIALFFTFQRYFVEGITMTGSKG